MTGPEERARVCVHGALARVCAICELEERVRELEAALRPFAEIGSRPGLLPVGVTILWPSVMAEDLRRAAAALAREPATVPPPAPCYHGSHPHGPPTDGRPHVGCVFAPGGRDYDAGLKKRLDEACEAIDTLGTDVDEHLPEYVCDADGTAANVRERIEFAGQEIAVLRRVAVAARPAAEALRMLAGVYSGTMLDARRAMELLRALDAAIALVPKEGSDA